MQESHQTPEGSLRDLELPRHWLDRGLNLRLGVIDSPFAPPRVYPRPSPCSPRANPRSAALQLGQQRGDAVRRSPMTPSKAVVRFHPAARSFALTVPAGLPLIVTW